MKRTLVSITILSLLLLQSGCGLNKQVKEKTLPKKYSVHRKYTPKSNKSAPVYTMPKNYTVPLITPKTKVAYLTFDDGPSKTVTSKMLDILDKYKIKATFFVVGKYAEKYPKVIQRMYNDGQSIGNHSYSHSYNKIYSSWNALYDEVLKTNAIIYKYTHAKCYLFRAPGGSKPFMAKNNYIEKMEASGLKIFDWNCTTNDGLNKNLAPSVMLYNVEKTADENHLFVLMHTREDNKNSLRVLPQVIEYLKHKGYTFRPIIKETKELRF